MVAGAKREIQIMHHVTGHPNIVELVVRALLGVACSIMLCQSAPIAPASCPRRCVAAARAGASRFLLWPFCWRASRVVGYGATDAEKED